MVMMLVAGEGVSIVGGTGLSDAGADGEVT